MTTDDRYLSFLAFCLDPETAAPDCTSEIVWHDLLHFAKRQSLVGVFFYGMKRLEGHANKPTDDDVMEWYWHAKQIEEANRLMYERSAYVERNFRKEGFPACILKGQGNALLYPDPYMRTPGDIDVWLKAKDSDVIAYVRRLAPDAETAYHHIQFPKVKDVDVEAHYRPAFLFHPLANRRLQQYFRSQADEQFRNHVASPDRSAEFSTPTRAFNRIFQMAHLANHFFHEGIGLRQIVDYYYLLHQPTPTRELQADAQLLEKLHLRGFAGAVGWILSAKLQLDNAQLPVAPDPRRGRLLLSEALKAGNFGKHDTRPLHSSQASRGQKNLQRLYRDLRLAPSFPAQCLCEPPFRLWHFVWRLRHR